MLHPAEINDHNSLRTHPAQGGSSILIAELQCAELDWSTHEMLGMLKSNPVLLYSGVKGLPKMRVVHASMGNPGAIDVEVAMLVIKHDLYYKTNPVEVAAYVFRNVLKKVSAQLEDYYAKPYNTPATSSELTPLTPSELAFTDPAIISLKILNIEKSSSGNNGKRLILTFSDPLFAEQLRKVPSFT